MPRNEGTTSSRAQDLFSDLQNVSSDSVASDVKKLSDAFARSEFLNNRAFGGSISVTQDIKNRTVTNRTITGLKDDLSTILELDYAATDDESTVISPAAYFYDLMRIVTSCINISGDDSAKYSLLARRPDLLDIPLDKANTTTDLFPSLAIVNYVLARQLMIKEDAALCPTIPASPSPLAPPLSYASLMSSYEKAAFNKIKTLSFDIFHVPFDVDFESQQAYLNAMGKPLFDTYRDVYSIVSPQAPSMTFSLAKAYLGLSDAVVAQLAAPAVPNIAHDGDAPVSADSAATYSIDSRTFCKQTHISYERLGELLHMNVSDSVARKYVAALGPDKFYVNKGSDPALKLALPHNSDRESLQYLTDDRLKRIGLLHFMSKQLGMDCDELELIFSFLKIGSSISSSDIVHLALLRKFQKDYSLSTTSLVNMLAEPEPSNAVLYSVVMENIRPVTGPMAIWELHWKLLPAYLTLLTEDINSAFDKAATFLLSESAKRLLGYADVSNNLASTNLQNKDYFKYYANQTLAYLCRIGGLSLEELRMVYLYQKSSLENGANVNYFIQSVYALGQLKTSFNRSLVELCQLVCCIDSDHQFSSLVRRNRDDVITKGLASLFNTLNLKLPSSGATTLPKCSGDPADIQCVLAPDNQDLFIFLQKGTASGHTEVHVLSAASGYRSFSDHFVTYLEESGPEWQFLVSSNRDIYGVLKTGSGSSKTELHVLSAAKNYQEFSLRVATKLEHCGSEFQFLLGANNDLYGILKTGASTTELHVLSEAMKYKDFSLRTATGLGRCGSEYQFFLGPNNDLYGALKQGANSVEVHAYSSEKNKYERKIVASSTLFSKVMDNSVQFQLGDDLSLLRIDISSGTTVSVQAALSNNSYTKLKNYQVTCSLQALLSLSRLNQNAIEKNWNLDDLVLSRFGILSAEHENQITDIRQGLLQPFFRNLKEQESLFTHSDSSVLTYSTLDNKNVFVTHPAPSLAESVKLLDNVIVNPLRIKSTSGQHPAEISFIKQQLMTERCLEMLEINVAKLFGIDKNVFHRFMTSFDDLGCAFYCQLIFKQADLSELVDPSVLFMQRTAAIINLFNLKPSTDESARSQFESIILELNASVQKLADAWSTHSGQKIVKSAKKTSSSDSGKSVFTKLLEKITSFSDERLIPQNLMKFFKNLTTNLSFLTNSNAPIFAEGAETDSTGKLDLSTLNRVAAHFYRLKNIDFDDIDVLIDLISFPSGQYRDDIFSSSISDIFSRRSYKNSQEISNASSLLQSLGESIDASDDSVFSNFLQISLSDWSNLKTALSFNTLVTLLSDRMDRVDQITKLKGLLAFFEYDTNLVIAFLKQNKLKQNNPQFISQHVSQVLQKKNGNAYEKATRSLNERKRDVLVDAVLRTFHADHTYDSFHLDNPDKLSEYLLIDVLISGEDKQTPIIQAHSTLQWYMRRCVEGIEQDSYDGLKDIMNVSKIREEWWSWIQNYRVWEANRQVFLYPENFLSPDLRVNQSEQFYQLSKTLRKPHLDDDAIEAAYLQYVSDVMKLRDLTISAICAEPAITDLGGNIITRKLHLFARNNAKNSQYYHCTAEQNSMTDSALSSNFWYEFLLVPDGSDDVFLLRKNQTASRYTEIYVLSGETRYQRLKAHYVTALGQCGSEWQFMLSKNRDLYGVLKKGSEPITDSSKTELYLFSAASNYKTITRWITGLGHCGPERDFLLDLNNDLYSILRDDSGTHCVAIQRMSRSSGYAAPFTMSKSTSWPAVGNDSSSVFLFDPKTNDLGMVHKDNNGNVQISYLSAASSYESKAVYKSSVRGNNASWGNFVQLGNNQLDSNDIDSPAFATFNGNLYCAYRRQGDAEKLTYITSSDGKNWSGIHQHGSARMSKSPALVEFNNSLYFFHQGQTGKSLWYSTIKESGFVGEVQVPVSMYESPSATVYQESLYCFYQGETNSLCWSSLSGDPDARFIDRSAVGNNAKATGSPAAVVFNNKLYCFYQGALTGVGTLWYSFYNNSIWVQQQIPNVSIDSSPAVAVFDGVLFCSFRKLSNMYYIVTENGYTWSDPIQVSDANVFGSPALGVFNRQLFFGFGGNCVDNRLMYQTLNVMGSHKYNFGVLGDGEYRFLFNSSADLVAFKTSGNNRTHTGTSSIEVHTLSKGSGYNDFNWHGGSVLREILPMKTSNTFQNWTFWEKLPLNISETFSMPLKAIYVNNRPYLYWTQKIILSPTISLPTGSATAASTVTNEPQTQVQLFCSYQHLDGSWEAAQLLDAADWADFLPGIDSTNLVYADQLVFDPRTIKTTIDKHGRYNKKGNEDPNPYGLDLVENCSAVQEFPDAFSHLLDQLYQALNTQTMESVIRFDFLNVDDVKYLSNQDPMHPFPQDSMWGQYYWELMYFSLLTMANALQTTQQYDKALAWYKGVFNPSRRSSDSRSPFVFAPFNKLSGNDILSPLLNTKYLNDLHLHAFEAHRMAQLRGSLSYKKYMVMQYIQNLLAWGDSLFRENTRESITEAIGRYLAASDLLGDSPRKLYSATYDDSMQHSTVYDLFNAMITSVPALSLSTSPSSPTGLVIYPYNYCVASYFHVPENREFMALWSNVGDRLFKIRHCLSIAGVKQQLALLSPAIDPHDLVRAVAARGGEFVREMLAEISGKNRPPYRFLVLLERAKEFAGFVERLGDSLLSMLERQDNAGLVKLNNEFAQQMLDMMTKQKEAGIKQAECDKHMLDERQKSIQVRIDYYNGLLPNSGMTPEEIAAEGVLASSAVLNCLIQGVGGVSQAAGALPQVGSPFAMTYGGTEISKGLAAAIGPLATVSTGLEFVAGVLQRTANYKSRYAEWKLQLSLAQKELEELDIQKRAADIRIDVAKEDLEQHKKSIDHQQKVSLYNNKQFTNVDLYAWYAEQLYELLTNAYELAMRVANQAASAYQYELRVPSTASLTGFWASSRKGLLSGTRLTQQLHQMQQDYLENNARLPEIEKVLSLRDIYTAKNADKSWSDAISDLKNTGVTFTLGTDLFRDFSKRTDGKLLSIKMVSVSVPALAGPNQQVNLLLTNTSSPDEIYISRGVSATGMFSASLDDARYLPFEGKQLDDDSQWTLSLGGESSTSYDSIPDIQLRVLYVIQSDPNATPGSSL